MPKTRQQKEETLKFIKEKLDKTNAVVFTNFDGLSVLEATDLRRELRDNNIDYTVAKKTLLKLALKNADYKEIDLDSLDGGLGIAFGYEDEVLPAKTLSEFSKKHPALKLVGGIFEKKFIDEAKVKELASLPGKQELYSKIVWLFNYPASGFVNVLAGNIKNLIYALQAVKDKKA